MLFLIGLIFWIVMNLLSVMEFTIKTEKEKKTFWERIICFLKNEVEVKHDGVTLQDKSLGAYTRGLWVLQKLEIGLSSN